jgi:hypothetical protein
MYNAYLITSTYHHANLPTQRQTVSQTVSFSNLNAFSSLAGLTNSYSAHLSTASGTSSKGINVTVKSVHVTVKATFSKAVSNAHAQQGFAQQASVPSSSVTIMSSGGRRLKDSGDIGTQVSSTTVNGEIEVPNNSGQDIVAAAKAIHAAMSNTSALAAKVGNVAGVSLTVTTDVGVKFQVQAVLANNGKLNAANINDAIATALGANVTGTVHDGTSSTTARSPGPGPELSGAEFAGRIQVVLMACVLLALTRRLGF